MPRRHGLQKLFSAFPAGWPGVGLILLRLAVASSAIAQGICVVTPSNGATSSVWIAALISIIVGCALLIGILTPIAGLAATSGYLVRGFTLLLSRKAGMHDGAFPCIDLAVISLALVLLGPGLYSLDAQLFGRREIIIPGGRRPPL